MQVAAAETLGKVLKSAVQAGSRFAGNPVVRGNVANASKIATEVGDMAKKGFQTLADSELGKKAMKLAKEAEPIAGGLASNVINKLTPHNDAPHTDDNNNTPNDSTDKGQTVNLADLLDKAKNGYDTFRNTLGKRKNDEILRQTDNPQDAQAFDSKDGGGGEPLNTKHKVMAPEETKLEHLKEQEKQIKLQGEIDEQTIRNNELAIAQGQQIEKKGLDFLKQQVSSIESMADDMGARRRAQLASIVPASPSSPQSSQQPSQYPQQQYQQPLNNYGYNSPQNQNQNASNFFNT